MLEKQAKKKRELQRKVDRDKARLAEKGRERNLIEERLNSTKPLDDLNERESELRQQNSEDQAIIDATDTSPSEREAAEARVEVFSLFHTNVRSLKRNFENLHSHLLNELGYPFNIIGITETRMKMISLIIIQVFLAIVLN